MPTIDGIELSENKVMIAEDMGLMDYINYDDDEIIDKSKVQ